MSPAANRRTADRHAVVVAVQIDSQERKERLGVTRDVSNSGTLVLSNSRFEIGERLEVSFQLSDDPGAMRRERGEVVRVERLEAGRMWRYAMAVRFDHPLPESADQVFAELEERE